MNKLLPLTISSFLLSGCASTFPQQELPVSSSDPYTQVEESLSRSSFKETAIIEELNASGCDISRFETMESSRRNVITVNCK